MTTAKRRRWIDPSEDPELIEQSRDLARQGEIAFLRDFAAAAENLVPNLPADIAEWAFDMCFIPAGKTTRGGKVRLTAVQRGLVRLLQRLGTEVLVLLKCPRLGASTLAAIILLYYACHEQCDVLLYERSDKTAQTFSKDKIMPILRASSKLKGLLRPDGKTGEQDTWDNRELLNGASLKHRSAANDDSFKGVRGRMIVGEEGGDSVWQAGGESSEGSKIDLLMRRGQEFADGKVFLSGTPTIKGSCLISAEYEKTDRCHFFMHCPHCGHYQPFVPDVRRVMVLGERYGAGLRYTLDERDVCDDAWYECAGLECTSPLNRIEEGHKFSMMEGGDFVSTSVGERGKVGAFIWMAYSEDPKASWKHIAEEHHKAFVKGGPDERKAFVTMFLAQPYDVSPTSHLTPSFLEERKRSWALKDGSKADGPRNAVFLSASIDCQRGMSEDNTKPPRMELTIFASGTNGQRAVIDHKIISHREFVDRFTGEIQLIPVKPFTTECQDMVWDILAKEYVMEDGRALRIKQTFVDNGWRPDLAQRFCRLRRSRDLGIIPIRGNVTERRGSRADLLPQSLTLQKGRRSGREYLWIGTQTAKDELARILAIPAEAPESIVFADHLGPEYFEGLLSDRLVTIRPGVTRWEQISQKNSGEPLDCLVYCFAAERYIVRKNARLKKLVDEVDPELQEAAMAARAALQVASIPVPPPSAPDGVAALQTAVEEEEGPVESAPRFRIVKRMRRADPPIAEGPTERVRRIKARKTGLGW